MPMNRDLLTDPDDTSNLGDLTDMATQIVVAYLQHHPVQYQTLPEIIALVYNAVFTNANPAAAQHSQRVAGRQADGKPNPAVPVGKSVTPEYIVCLEDGKKMKLLQRHLRTAYDMSPDEYRAKWNLPPDYPMIAPSYSALRSKMARDAGLGTREIKQDTPFAVQSPLVTEPIEDAPRIIRGRRSPRGANTESRRAEA